MKISPQVSNRLVLLEEHRKKNRSCLRRAISGLPSLEPVLQVLISDLSPWEPELVKDSKELICYLVAGGTGTISNLIYWEHVIATSGH